MAGPSIVVRVLGDLTGLSKAGGDAASAGESASSRLRSAFGGVLSQLNATGVLGPFGDALNGVQQSLDHLGAKSKDASAKMMGIGGTALGVGIALQSVGSKEKAATQQLDTAIKDTGNSVDAYQGQIETAVKSQERFGNTADATKDALATLTEMTHKPAEAIKDLSVVSDVAAAKHVDLNTAATMVGKTYEGNAKTLKLFGITTKESGEKAITDLANVTKGQAAASADTFNGKMKEMKARVEDAAASFANKYGPAITAAGALMTGLGATMEIVKAGQAALTAATNGQTVAQWALNAAMDANPILLVVLAIAALVAAFILVYTHCKTFRDAVDDLGHVFVAVFDAIKGAALDVFHWLESNWPLIVLLLLGPFGLLIDGLTVWRGKIIDFFTRLGSDILGAFKDAINWLEHVGEDIMHGLLNGITHGFDDVTKFLKSIPDKITGFLKNPLSIFSPSAVTHDIGVQIMAGLANGITAGMSGVQSAIGAAPGVITSTLATTAPSSAAPAMATGHGGSTLSIGQAHFASGVDLDLLMHKLAAAQRQARL